MPRRWLWSLLDIAGLILVGQATILAQREAAGPPPRLDAAVELSRAEAQPGEQPARIFQAGRAIVVELKVAPSAAPPKVAVVGRSIRLSSVAGGIDQIPVPAGADPSRYQVRVAGDELRVIFDTSAAAETD